MAFLLLSVILSAIAVCCYGGMGYNMYNNPDFIQIQGVMCNNKTRPSPAQWTAFLECVKPSNDTKPPGNGKIRAKFAECVSKADDVNALKTNNAVQDEQIILTCSQKCKDCFREVREQWKKERVEKADKPKPEGGDHPKPNRKDMKKKNDMKLSCMKLALNV